MAQESEYESEHTIMLFFFSVLKFAKSHNLNVHKYETVVAIRRNVLDLNSALSNLSIRVKTYIGDNSSGVMRRLNSTENKLCKNAIS